MLGGGVIQVLHTTMRVEGYLDQHYGGVRSKVISFTRRRESVKFPEKTYVTLEWLLIGEVLNVV